jgi:flavin reductase (DIM6/NTAB) family NADH-FMN oxidoreductase RutF/rubredoxin
MIDFTSFHKLSYGLYLICSEFKGKKSGYVGNTGFQVTSSPSTIAISCNKNNFTCDIISQSRLFSLSVLQSDLDIAIVQDFGFKSSNDFNKFEKYKYKTGGTGIPVVIEYCIATFECRVFKEVDCGTHILFIGEVIECERLNDEPPLTYNYYHQHYKMLAPKNAPTYIAPELLLEERKELITPNDTPSEYICTICGYTYNPEEGDPSNGIAPGTPFEELPDDYRCPVCKAEKDFFREV